MITTHSPIEYRKRPAPRQPQTVRLCLDCGGTCVDLPRQGVACLDCHGTRFVTVAEADAYAKRREIYENLAAVTGLLSRLAAVPAPYPAELMAQTRAEFVAKIREQS